MWQRITPSAAGRPLRNPSEPWCSPREFRQLYEIVAVTVSRATTLPPTNAGHSSTQHNVTTHLPAWGKTSHTTQGMSEGERTGPHAAGSSGRA